MTTIAANELRRQVTELEQSAIVIDFRDVEYLDSVILGAIVAGCRDAQNDCKQAVLCNACPTVKNILDKMRLDTVWPYYDTLEQAFAAIAENVN